MKILTIILLQLFTNFFQSSADPLSTFQQVTPYVSTIGYGFSDLPRLSFLGNIQPALACVGKFANFLGPIGCFVASFFGQQGPSNQDVIDQLSNKIDESTKEILLEMKNDFTQLSNQIQNVQIALQSSIYEINEYAALRNIQGDIETLQTLSYLIHTSSQVPLIVYQLNCGQVLEYCNTAFHRVAAALNDIFQAIQLHSQVSQTDTLNQIKQYGDWLLSTLALSLSDLSLVNIRLSNVQIIDWNLQTLVTLSNSDVLAHSFQDAVYQYTKYLWSSDSLAKNEKRLAFDFTTSTSETNLIKGLVVRGIPTSSMGMSSSSSNYLISESKSNWEYLIDCYSVVDYKCKSGYFIQGIQLPLSQNKPALQCCAISNTNSALYNASYTIFQFSQKDVVCNKTGYYVSGFQYNPNCGSPSCYTSSGYITQLTCSLPQYYYQPNDCQLLRTVPDTTIYIHINDLLLTVNEQIIANSILFNANPQIAVFDHIYNKNIAIVESDAYLGLKNGNYYLVQNNVAQLIGDIITTQSCQFNIKFAKDISLLNIQEQPLFNIHTSLVLHCDDNCATCSEISSNCTSCNLHSKWPYFLNNSCFSSCPDMHYQVNDTCQACSTNCQLCLNSTFCLACKSDNYLHYNQCVNSCPYKYYQANNTCQSCSNNCLICLNSTLCMVCNSDNYLYKNQCVNSCPIRTTQLANNTCKDCNKKCLTCFSNIDMCLSCDLDSTIPYLENYDCVSSCNQSFAYQNSCRNTCPGGYYGQLSTMSCQKCPSNYVSFQNECVASCPFGYYISGSQCQKCSLNCATCAILATNCTSCSGNQVLLPSKNQCKDSCPIGLFRNFSVNECQQCPKQSYFYQGNCVKVCPDGFYIDYMNSICQECDKSCKTCTFKQQCQSCYNGSVLQNQDCVLNCDKGYYANESGICIYCFNYLLNNRCYLICPSGYYAPKTSNICQKCDSKCATCENSSASCKSCYSGQYLYQSACLSQCPKNTLILLNGTCQDCPMSSFYLNNTCISACPDYYYADSNRVCQYCVKSTTDKWCAQFSPKKSVTLFLQEQFNKENSTQIFECTSTNLNSSQSSNYYWVVYDEISNKYLPTDGSQEGIYTNRNTLYISSAFQSLTLRIKCLLQHNETNIELIEKVYKKKSLILYIVLSLCLLLTAVLSVSICVYYHKYQRIRLHKVAKLHNTDNHNSESNIVQISKHIDLPNDTQKNDLSFSTNKQKSSFELLSTNAKKRNSANM